MKKQLLLRDNKLVEKELEKKRRQCLIQKLKKVMTKPMREYKANLVETGVDKLVNQVENMLNYPSFSMMNLLQ